jgi:2-(1,2-epoxy-1,2-dihydrophenyl)acetyl-CoA isomerase
MSSGKPMSAGLVLLDREGDVARVTLNRPERHNSLVPELMEALNAALDALLAAPPRVLVLAGSGRSFSTGGDVRAFADVLRSERRAYAAHLVGALNAAILKLVVLPCPVVARVHGAVTGGSAGFLFAADLVVMAKEAFLQPFYVDVGFSPDGGWTALLPERIGAARAGEIQMLNQRLDAERARALGLASLVCDAQDLDLALKTAVSRLLGKSPESLAATKALLWHFERRAALAAGLTRELESFLDHIDRPETEAGMQRFLEKGA